MARNPEVKALAVIYSCSGISSNTPLIDKEFLFSEIHRCFDAACRYTPYNNNIHILIEFVIGGINRLRSNLGGLADFAEKYKCLDIFLVLVVADNFPKANVFDYRLTDAATAGARFCPVSLERLLLVFQNESVDGYELEKRIFILKKDFIGQEWPGFRRS